MIGRVILLAALLFAAAAARAENALAPLVALQQKGAAVGALVVRLDNDQILAALDPDTALTPASTSKLYVTAAALSRWGGDYRFRTRLLADGPISGDTLRGDLVFVGSGDPTFTNQTLATLVRRFAASGVRRVTGDLVVNAGYFGKLACVPKDRCAAKTESSNSYDARLSSATINFSNVAVAVTPATAAGQAATVRQLPYALPMFTLRNRATTTRGGRATISLSRASRNGHDRLTVRGHVPVGAATRRYYVAVGDPNRYAGELLRAFLAAAGIRVDGKVRVNWTAPSGREIAAVRGQPLWIVLRRMLVWSNNFMADTLTLDLLRAHTAPPLSLTAAGAALTHFARNREAASKLMRKHEPGVFLASGSGLTAASLASARDLVALLDVMYRRTDLFPGFLGALTVPAHTPVGMLKDAHDRPWMRRIAVKTGSLYGRFKVFALAGYIRLPDDSWGAFAVLVNGTEKYQPSIATDIAAARAALTPFLQP